MTGNRTLYAKLTAVSDLIRLKKQYGTLLVLWPTLWSLFIASKGHPSLKHLVVFVLGTFVMRSAGCAINDIADRNFDGKVERTRERPIASGRLRASEALLIFAVLAIAAFALVLLLNKISVILSIGGILLASTYPFVKRYSHFPQTVLGIAFGWGAVMAWAAVTGSVGAPGLLIFVANIFWSMAYDTMYAIVDMKDDVKIGVKSTAIYFGKSVWGAVSLFYVLMTCILAAAGFVAGLGIIYFSALAVCLIIYLVIVLTAKTDGSPEAAFKAFLANAAVGGVMLAAIIIDLI